MVLTVASKGFGRPCAGAAVLLHALADGGLLLLRLLLALLFLGLDLLLGLAGVLIAESGQSVRLGGVCAEVPGARTPVRLVALACAQGTIWLLLVRSPAHDALGKG